MHNTHSAHSSGKGPKEVITGKGEQSAVSQQQYMYSVYNSDVDSWHLPVDILPCNVVLCDDFSCGAFH